MIDFRDLSNIAQRIFVCIDRYMLSLGVDEVYISKAELSWRCAVSIPNVKIGLRELKNTGYIITRNDNSCYMKIGPEYAYCGVELGEYIKRRRKKNEKRRFY